MCKCEIKWVNRAGETTADDNEAIGRVRTRARVEQHHGRAITFESSQWFNICAQHAERLHEPGMHIWDFEPFAAPVPSYCAVAVDKAIASSNRAGRRISKREAEAIHRLLRGRR